MFETILERLIIEGQEIKFSYTARNLLNPKDLSSNLSFALIGPRRAGKSFFLHQIKDEMQKLGHNKTEFIYLNFEDPNLVGFKKNNFEEILDAFKKLGLEKKPIMLLDEIQNVEYWHLFVRKLVDNQYKVFVTGSNSNLLSKEIASHLGARTHPIHIYPLSFKEYLNFKGIEVKEAREIVSKKIPILLEFEQFLQRGGFPEVSNLEENRVKTVVENYLELAINDILKRKNISNSANLGLIFKKLRENIGNEYTLTSIKESLEFLGFKIGLRQIYEYTQFMEESFLTCNVYRFKKSFAKRQKARKTYLIDNSYLSLLDTTSEDKGQKLENLVYLELLKKGISEIFYFKENQECDFVVKSKNSVELIQVTAELNANNNEREINGLLEAMEKLEKEDGLILTINQERNISNNGKKITVKPVWKWLLEP